MPDALLGCSTHFLAAPPRCLGMAREGRVGEPPDPDTIGAVAKVSTGVAAKKVMHGVAHGVVAKVLHGLAKVMHGLAAKVTIGVANGVVAILGIPPLTGIHGLTIRLGRVSAVVARTKRRRVI